MMMASGSSPLGFSAFPACRSGAQYRPVAQREATGSDTGPELTWVNALPGAARIPPHEAWRSAMNAADIMTPDVLCATPDTRLPNLIGLMLENGVSAVPIVESGRLVGIVSEGDLLRRAETGTDAHASRWI